MAPMTNAERQKKYRQKLKENNPEKYNEKRIAHLEKVKENKRKVSELTDSEKEKRRRKWREYSAKYYEKQKINTKKIKKKQKKWRQNTWKCKKEISELTYKLQIQIKKNRCLQKQMLRLKKKAENIQPNDDTCCLLTDMCKHKQENVGPQSLTKEALTPMKKTESFIENLSCISKDDREKLKEKILELNVLSNSLNLCYQSATKPEKQIIKKIMKNPITQKYKIVTKLTKKTIGLTGRIRKNLKITEKRRKVRIQEIHTFFNRDDVTRCTAGKKETKTKNKCKVQRRYLTDSIKNLYKKYKKEGGKASYSSLLRHRPFYVLSPKLANCESCACVKHENFSFMACKLHKIGVLKTAYIEEILRDLSCDLNSKECMYGDCTECSEKTNEIDANKDIIETSKVTYWQWVFKTVQYPKKKEDGTVENLETKKYKKEVTENSIKELISKFKEEAKKFKRHYFNINHQQKKFKECKKKIKSDEAVIICDFSENYNCRYNKEIQGMHFGSSRNQITLHTGVAYVKDQEPISFCTLSPCNEHNPYSIWAHLTPVIKALKLNFPAINKIHFFSDGPSTQYRQKLNFILFSKLTKKFGFSHCTWNYFEAAHGKNAADGIGGAIKRTLDSQVTYGMDIPDAETAYQVLKKSSKICLELVTETDINAIKKFLANTITKPLKGTMSVHQILTTEDESVIKYRDVSCLCGELRGFCACFAIKDHRLITETKTCSEVNQNRKVTVLADISLTEQNKRFIRNLPLSLKEIKLDTDLLSGNSITQSRNRKSKKCHSRSFPEIDINEYGCLSSDEQTEVSKSTMETSKSITKNKRKRPTKNSASKGKNKNIKRKRRSSNASTTSESAEISIYSDSDLQDALSDIENEEYNTENLRRNNLEENDETNVINKIKLNVYTRSKEDKSNQTGDTEIELHAADVERNIPVKIDVTKKEFQINHAEKIVVLNSDVIGQGIEINSTKKQVKDIVQVKLCKNIEVNEKENVTVLSRIKGAPENTAYQDITKCDVFRKKGAFSEINSFTINSEALKSFDIQKSEVKKAENYINFLTRGNEIENEEYEPIEDTVEREIETERDAKDENGDDEKTKTIDDEKIVIKESEQIETGNGIIDTEEMEFEGDYKDKNEDVITVDGGKNETDKFKTKDDTKLEIVNKKSIKTTDNENIETEEEKMTETPEETTDTEIDKLETEGDTENEFIYNINDSVIVRYYQRKIWKYFIGFVIAIEKKDGEAHYKVKFLKTIKDSANSVKFSVQRKIDIDIITSDFIVKKVNIAIFPQDSKQYYLVDDFDEVYFK